MKIKIEKNFDSKGAKKYWDSVEDLGSKVEGDTTTLTFNVVFRDAASGQVIDTKVSSSGTPKSRETVKAK